MQLQLRGQIQVPACGKGCTTRSLLLPLAAVAPHVLQSAAAPCVAGKEGRQPAGWLRETLSVRFWSSCCSQLLSIIWTEHSAAPPIPAQHLGIPTPSCTRRVPGTILSLGNRYELCLLWDLFTPAGRDWQILLSLATCVQLRTQCMAQ